MYTFKVVLQANNKQESKLRKTMNQCILCNQIVYDYLDSFIKDKKKIPSKSEVRKWFTKVKKEHDDKVVKERKELTNKQQREKHLDTLFYDVSNDALKQEVKDTYDSFVRFFKKLSKYPRRKKYNNIKKSFYVDPYKIRFENGKVKLEKIANNQKSNRQVLNYIRLAEKERIPVGKDIKYYNPRVVYDGLRFYLSVTVDDKYTTKRKEKEKEEKTIGIDVNIKEIVTSNDVHYKNVTVDKKIKKQYKKVKRIQKDLSRKYESIKRTNKKIKDSKNYIKCKTKLRWQYERLSNLKEQHLREIIEDIFETAPNRIVVESLDIKSMQKNKMISGKIQLSSFRKFYYYLKDKARKYDVKIIEANKYYPSSKKCSCCSSIKKELKLSERIYKCDVCGLNINRDLNAAINLAKY